MDVKSEVIHNQMEETRSALQEKLETLEQKVQNTVQDATEAVNETVESVKGAVHETVETVKETVQGTVESVKETFDLPRQVQTHPWTMFFGAAALGFVATRLLNSREAEPQRWSKRRESESAAPFAKRAASQFGNGHAAGASQPSSSPSAASSTKSWLINHYGEEIAKVKGLALGTLGAVVRDMLTSSLGSDLGEHIKDVVNGITVKMGGQVMDNPLPSFAKGDDTAAKSTAGHCNKSSTAGSSDGTEQHKTPAY